MLTKKHFENIASIIRTNTHTSSFPKDEMKTYISTWVVQELIYYFKEQNQNFNENKFKKVCGIDN